MQKIIKIFFDGAMSVNIGKSYLTEKYFNVYIVYIIYMLYICGVFKNITMSCNDIRLIDPNLGCGNCNRETGGIEKIELIPIEQFKQLDDEIQLNFDKSKDAIKFGGLYVNSLKIRGPFKLSKTRPIPTNLSTMFNGVEVGVGFFHPWQFMYKRIPRKKKKALKKQLFGQH